METVVSSRVKRYMAFAASVVLFAWMMLNCVYNGHVVPTISITQNAPGCSALRDTSSVY